MYIFRPVSRMLAILAIALIVLINFPADGQISTPCTPSMLSTFSPCMNFLTNSSSNGTSPSQQCCSSLKNLTSNGVDCFCLIATGSVPFQIPINRSLAISLPRACNMPGVPLQCKATGSPVPASGPASLGPTLSPRISPSASPKASVVPEPTPSAIPPESSTTPVLPPPSTTVGTGAPTSTTGSRPVLTPPSAAVSSHSFSPSLLIFALGFVTLKYY
ncbi:non-specific lipid-transfer protein-like protein At2g13820 [Jatropha curcas]|uniref:non-specific lipid-transfer protein-like protein At2g13820 n=1 Tax=Jatropha curcas TaxID=180498 RepID=UPI0005FAE865|nr:non-specific lipid-transfer protein-like protein At2g13820 [Jatropha curcas]